MALHPSPYAHLEQQSLPFRNTPKEPAGLPKAPRVLSDLPLAAPPWALGSLRDGVCTDILRTHGLELEDRERKVPVAPYLSARAVSSSLPSKAEKKTVRWGLLALQRSLGGAAQQGRGSFLLESLTQCYNCLLLLSRPTPRLPASSAKETPRLRTLICGLP